MQDLFEEEEAYLLSAERLEQISQASFEATPNHTVFNEACFDNELQVLTPMPPPEKYNQIRQHIQDEIEAKIKAKMKGSSISLNTIRSTIEVAKPEKTISLTGDQIHAITEWYCQEGPLLCDKGKKETPMDAAVRIGGHIWRNSTVSPHRMSEAARIIAEGKKTNKSSSYTTFEILRRHYWTSRIERDGQLAHTDPEQVYVVFHQGNLERWLKEVQLTKTHVVIVHQPIRLQDEQRTMHADDMVENIRKKAFVILGAIKHERFLECLLVYASQHILLQWTNSLTPKDLTNSIYQEIDPNLIKGFITKIERLTHKNMN